MSSEFTLDLQASHPLIMGILNATPDSFSDGGVYSDTKKAVAHARQMVSEGADIIDVGGESTRPGAPDVDVGHELSRVIPIIEAITADEHIQVPVSVDTSKPEVMREAVRAGATMVNDVRALQAPGAIELCSELSVQVCLMHMLGQPRTMQSNPVYKDVVESVMSFLNERLQLCLKAGIQKDNIVLDPGFGFGKSLKHNLCLLKKLDQLCLMGYPVLVGVSRKSMFQQILAAPVGERIIGSVTAAVIATGKGAQILRVHDVKATADALKVYKAIEHADC